jgi:hypothetical protein
MRTIRSLGTAAACGLVLAAGAGAEGTTLSGVTGPGFSISLVDGSGASVSHLDPGSFSLIVDDRSADHNFHLKGPGVDVATGVEAIGVKTFAVTLAAGSYTYVCDLHPNLMAGSFTVGASPSPEPPTTPRPSPAPAPRRLVLIVTSKSVRLTGAGKRVTSLDRGRVQITVRDRSAAYGVALRGAGVKRATSARFVGTVTWSVKLSSGTLSYSRVPKKPVPAGGRVRVS